MTGQAARVTVTIKDLTGAGKVTGTITIKDIDSHITLRDLIQTQVHEDVARYNANLTGIFRGLVMPSGAQPAPGGFRIPAGSGRSRTCSIVTRAQPPAAAGAFLFSPIRASFPWSGC